MSNHLNQSTAPVTPLAANMSLARPFVIVHLLLVQKNKVLLGLRTGTGFADGMYGLPAGKVEAKESALAGMIREAQEELGIELHKSDLELVSVIHHLWSDHARKEGLSENQMIQQWSFQDAILQLDSIDADVTKKFAEGRAKHYRDMFRRLRDRRGQQLRGRPFFVSVRSRRDEA